jgi:uncharacterized protein (DUF2267 family)
MGYREMIKAVQSYSGFSGNESESALRTFIKMLSSRLTPDEREGLASQLPAELQDDALQTQEIATMEMEDMMHEMAETQHVDEGRAKQQMMAAWQALKDAVSPGEIRNIQAQLPRSMTSVLQ